MAASKDKARAILSYATPNPVGPYRLITPPSPDLGRKTQTPVTPIMGGALVNLPTPVKPTKQTTPVAPPMADKLVNVPKQQGRVVDKSYEDDLSVLLRAYDNTQRLTRGDVYAFSRDRQIALSEVYRRAKDYVETTSDPIWKSVYETTRNESLDRGVDKKDAHEYAVQNVLDTATFAKIYGVKRSALPSVNIDELEDFETLLDGSGSDLLAFGELPGRVQETVFALSKGWNGTAKELLDAARSLSK